MTRQVEEVIGTSRTRGDTAPPEVYYRTRRAIGGAEFEGPICGRSTIGHQSDIAAASAYVKGTHIEGIETRTQLERVIRRRVAAVARTITHAEGGGGNRGDGRGRRHTGRDWQQ